ncbi:NADP-dependent oxidoreductase [Acidovorax sp. LjRoot118]|uniref:NADP-dependent oxidoreductase n=1 Tax=unclassified Acidovorax TaxID=2684926 RepID=UPI003ED0B025
MKALRIHGFGGQDQAVLEEAALRSPVDAQVAVRVEAASINPLDLKILAGHMQSVFPVALPYTLGTDFAGVVEAVGPLASRFRLGDRVVGRLDPTKGGALAQAALVPEQALCLLPASMAWEQAAALPTAAGTAWLALFGVGRLQAGQRVLVHAAAGGVGSFAVQLARQARAYVVATASARNQELVSGLGAHEVIDYQAGDFAAQAHGLDLVIDTVGGLATERSWPLIRPGGALVSLVDHAIADQGAVRGAFAFFKHDASVLDRIVERFGAGRLQVVLDTVHSLDGAHAAIDKVATGHARGKVIVRTSH